MRRYWPFPKDADVARRRSDHLLSGGGVRSRWWLPAFVLGLGAAGLLAVIPYSSQQWDFVFLCVSLLSLVVLLGAALLMPPGVRGIWWSLFAFQTLTISGQALFDRSADSLTQGLTSFPGWPDVLFLLAYIPVFVALGVLIHRLNPGRDREAWIDSSILSIAAASVFGLFLIAPILSIPGMDGWAIVVAVAYPILDLAVLSSLIWVLVGGGRPQPSLALLVISFTMTLTSDIARDMSLIVPQSGLSAGWLDALRIAALVTMAAAASTPSAESIATPRERTDPRVTTPRLAVLAVGVLAVPILVALRLSDEEARATLLLALASIAVIILAVWRIKILVTAVERQRQVTELVLDSAGDGIVGLDRQGFVLFANLSARRMLRCRESDLVGRRFHDIAHHERPDGTPFPWHECPVSELVVTGGEAFIPDQVYVRRDGTTFPVEMIMSPLVIEGVVMGAVQSFRDVSERQAIDELKRQFVSIVSHELRTPLTSIKGSLQMLDSGIMGPLSEEQQELLTMAVKNSERLGQLVNDILDLERLDSGRMPLTPEPTSATAIAAQAAAGMTGAADAAGIRLIAPEPAADADLDVTADPHRMVQVLTNLIGNAIKFSDRGSSISISVTRVDDEVHTAVSDRGRGIPEAQIATVFDRFGQVDPGDARREGGTGLGLAIAQEIVVRSGGRIEVASSLGKGSTFTVVLPALIPQGEDLPAGDAAVEAVLLPTTEDRG